MRLSSRLAAQWAARALVAVGTVYAMVASVDLAQHAYLSRLGVVQTSALRVLDTTLVPADPFFRPRFVVVYFGDSLAMAEAVTDYEKAVPMQLRRRLEATVVEAGAGEKSDLRMVPVTHSGLSVWTLYYVTDKIVGLRPEYVVVEFNLYNFSRFWQKRDRKVLAALLPLKRLPEMLTLPTGDTGLAMDEWAFSKLVLGAGALPWWETVQQWQERAIKSYWEYGDKLQRLVGRDKLEFRMWLYLAQMSKTQDSKRKRSTIDYSRKLLGPSLTGLDPENSTLRMFSTSLARLREAGIPVLVYVPPYNVEHLRELGLAPDSRLVESIELVREISTQHGARFYDAHALFDDTHFRDAMDHLSESEDRDGHRLLAEKLADAMAEDWRRIVTADR